MTQAGSIWRDDRCLWSDARLANTPLSRTIGLLGKRKLSAEEALWLHPCSAVHTWGMRFSIDVVWLDGDGRIIVLHEDLRPWRWAWPERFKVRDTLELAAGQIQRTRLQSGQQLMWRSVS